jgi:hypothetical protein
MGIDPFSKSRSNQQVAPVGFRESNRISKPIEIATTQLERSKAKAVHSSGVKVLKERQVISTFFEEDLPHEFLMRWSKEQSETPFGFGTELGCAHPIYYCC